MIEDIEANKHNNLFGTPFIQTMNVPKTCGENFHQLVPSFISFNYTNAHANYLVKPVKFANRRKKMQSLGVRASSGGEKQSERRSFLTLEEAGLVELSGLSTHERFLCRLTVRYGFNYVHL